LGEDIPGLAELESDFSMMLVNSHFSINHPRPTMPDVVEIGGVHCRPGRELPKDLEEFMSSSKDGVILFSLGSIFKGQDMPEETRKAFLNAFARLKQRVLWKWDFGDMTDLPPNVKLSKWLPVQDILAHPKTKLFITHGGLLSTQEAIYHGVPLVGVPLFGDQDLNIKRYVDLGIASSVEILGVQEKDISEAINAVLNDPTYKKNINEMSVQFRDTPMSALETAVFWSEYVMRHKGAPQLRSIARKLSFIQYHSLDVIAILFTILLGCLSLTVFVGSKLYRKLFRRTSAAVLDQKKNK
jgi:MGT family glycosyltransferase